MKTPCLVCATLGPLLAGSLWVARLMTPLPTLVAQQEKLEAEFRMAHVRVKEYKEEILFCDAVRAEERELESSFDRVQENRKRLIWRAFLLDLATKMFEYSGSFVNYGVLALVIFGSASFKQQPPQQMPGNGRNPNFTSFTSSARHTAGHTPRYAEGVPGGQGSGVAAGTLAGVPGGSLSLLSSLWRRSLATLGVQLSQGHAGGTIQGSGLDGGTRGALRAAFPLLRFLWASLGQRHTGGMPLGSVADDKGAVAQLISNASFATLQLIYGFSQILDSSKVVSEAAGYALRVSELFEAVGIPKTGYSDSDSDLGNGFDKGKSYSDKDRDSVAVGKGRVASAADKGGAWASLLGSLCERRRDSPASQPQGNSATSQPTRLSWILHRARAALAQVRRPYFIKKYGPYSYSWSSSPWMALEARHSQLLSYSYVKFCSMQ